jgi:hypothetical protein
MAEDQKSDNGELGKLALIADGLQNLYKGKSTIIFELESVEYDRMLSLFDNIEKNLKQFKIDISGTDFIFILIEGDK